MARELSAEQTKASYVERLGEPLGPTFFHLLQDFLRVLDDWDKYRALFGTNPERVNLLNSVSGPLTMSIERALWFSALIGIRRLTEALGKDKSVSVCLLAKMVSDPRMREALERYADDARTESALARRMINKRVAHADYDIAIGAKELSGISRSNIENALRKIARFVQEFAKLTLDETLVFEIISPLGNDVEDFLHVLNLGKQQNVASEERRRDLIAARDWQALDLLDQRPEWLVHEEGQPWRFDPSLD